MSLRRPAAAAVAALVCLAVLGPPPLARAQELPGARSAPAMMAVTEAMERKDWRTAAAAAANAGDPAAQDLVTWRRLSRGSGGWNEYRAFLARGEAWPSRERMRAYAERRMPLELPAAGVVRFFQEAPPQTGSGALRLADALAASGKADRAAAVAERAWRELSLTPEEEAVLFTEWSAAVKPHHVARLDMLLWRGLGGEAARMLPRVDAGWKALARARIALRGRKNGVDGLIKAVPAALQDDAGLAFERHRWRLGRKNWEGAEELLAARSTSAEALGRPESWASNRRSIARRAMRLGRTGDAYRLASRHYLTEGSDYADLEWLSGWLSLRFRDDPSAALSHFTRFEAAVETPISLGRAGYWRGRALEALGDDAGARAAYADGARFQTSFYGQLAAEKIDAAPDPAIAGGPPPTDWRAAAAMRTPPVRAGVLAHWGGDRRLSHWLLTNAAREAPTPRDMAAIAQLALELNRPEVAIRSAKIAARAGVVLPTPYYPVTELAQATEIPPALAMSVARQESELNPEAVSPAGARGLMQLMPRTAQSVSKKLGLAYNRGALTADWRYNARLGQSYMAGLLEEFGSMPLAAAGYNAGPHRVRQWIERYGDPRTGRVDMVDWIEKIPFRETRNYVQRVMEGVHVYNARISGAATPIRLSGRLSY